MTQTDTKLGMSWKEIRSLLRMKYLKNWEWHATSRTSSSRHYYLQLWLGSDRSKAKVSIKVFATSENEMWTAAVEFKGALSPRSNPNSSRQSAVDEAMALWWSQLPE
jgi:hypothetical protein